VLTRLPITEFIAGTGPNRVAQLTIESINANDIFKLDALSENAIAILPVPILEGKRISGKSVVIQMGKLQGGRIFIDDDQATCSKAPDLLCDRKPGF